MNVMRAEAPLGSAPELASILLLTAVKNAALAASPFDVAVAAKERIILAVVPHP